MIGEDGTYDETERRCRCEAGFDFNYNGPEGGACYRACSDLAHTDGSHFSSSPGSCSCAHGFVWDESVPECKITCDGPYDQEPAADGNSCTCVGAAEFYGAMGECLPVCARDSLSTGLFNQDTYGCNCVKNAAWSKTEAVCKCKGDYISNNGKCELPPP